MHGVTLDHRGNETVPSRCVAEPLKITGPGTAARAGPFSRRPWVNVSYLIEHFKVVQAFICRECQQPFIVVDVLCSFAQMSVAINEQCMDEHRRCIVMGLGEWNMIGYLSLPCTDLATAVTNTATLLPHLSNRSRSGRATRGVSLWNDFVSKGKTC